MVNEELTALMGGHEREAHLFPAGADDLHDRRACRARAKPRCAAKLGNMIKKGGKKPLLVACDVYRPAAIKQLQVVGGQVGVEVFERGQGNPVQIAKEAVDHAQATTASIP